MKLSLRPLLSLRAIAKQSQYVFLFIFVLYGCETPIDPKYYPDEAYEREPNVFCVISTGLDVQKALVGKTYKISDTIPGGADEWAGVSGTRVTIIGAGDTLKFDETDSAGIYVSAVSILPCSTYHLEVIYPDNKKVSGNTKTPGEFEILKPHYSDTVVIENDTLFWSKSIDADIYHVITFAWPPWDTTWLPWTGGWASDTSIPFNEFIYFDPFIDTLMIKVVAYDKNYHNYDRYGGVEYTNLEGGVGVFGSITITDSILIFVK